MSTEQKDDFNVEDLVLSFTFIASVFGALVFSSFLFLIQLGAERLQAMRDSRNAKARRLRWVHGRMGGGGDAW